jgi:hypothetical protein
MALVTLGTAATTTLTALEYKGAATTDDDVRALSALILNDRAGESTPTFALTQTGLSIPRRGLIRLMPGDYIGVDAATGWPIIVSAAAAAGAGYVHS